MTSSQHSPSNHDEIGPPNSGHETKFYQNMRTADKRLTELLAGGYAFSKGGDELLPIGPTETIATPFPLLGSDLDNK